MALNRPCQSITGEPWSPAEVTYKGRHYNAEIRDGRWIGSDGIPRNSPSEAAHAITGNNVNGWRFCEAKRPSDTEWRVMDQLR